MENLEAMGKDWRAVLSAIEATVPQTTFNRWFRPLNATRDDNGDVLILAEDEFDALFIEKNFSDLIRLHLEQIAGDRIHLKISHSPELRSSSSNDDDSSAATDPLLLHVSGVDTAQQVNLVAMEENSAEPMMPRISATTTTERIIDSGLKLQYSFEHFVVGPSNEFAYAASIAVAQKPGQAYNPLFLYGSTGLGKTHLLNAIGTEVIRRNPDKRVLYQTSESFMNTLIEHLQTKTMSAFRNLYRDGLDVLLIDDIHFIAGKDSTQQEFFHTFNALHQAGAQIVITSDRYPHEIPDLEERLRSRFQWGLVADIQAPGIETRLAILRKKAESLELKLNDDVALFIAQYVLSNVRELEGALLRLHAFVGFNNQPLTVQVARPLLKDFFQESTRQITVENIQKAVCAYYNVKLADLKGTSRHRSISFPRQIAMYLSKKYTGMSYPQLGEKFGGRDHTTVLAANQKITELMETDRSIKDALYTFEKQFTQQ